MSTTMKMQLISDFLQNFSNMLIDLHFISHEALFDRNLNKKLTIARAVDVSEAVKVLEKEKAIWKNQSRKENVYFSFSKDNETFNIAFVDDIEKIETFKKKDHFLLVQTSERKYQAYFKLDKPVSSFELYKIQKVLCHIYRGDVGALSPYQLKRLPYFYNTKYNPPFMVQEVFQGQNVIPVDKVLNYYKKHFEPNTNTNNNNVIKNISKTWEDFADPDLSVADMRYCCYLVRCGLSDEEIKQRLLAESPNITTRKRNVEDYLNRTIKKARNYVR